MFVQKFGNYYFCRGVGVFRPYRDRLEILGGDVLEATEEEFREVLGVPAAVGKLGRWTPEELDFIRRTYTFLGPRTIGKLLDRDENAVRNFWRKYGH